VTPASPVDPLRSAALRDPAARAVLADALEARGELEAAAAVRAFTEPRTLGDLDLRADYAESNRAMGPRLLVVANLAEQSPGHTGAEVFTKLRERRRDLRVLFSSGYSAGALDPELVSQPRCGQVEKPYDQRTLLAAVRAALDGE
jgi:ActR/RegA family two-component response regulator